VPFSNPAGDGPARVVLEQVDDTQFRVLAPFKYIDPSGREYAVPASDPSDPNDVTDLASVPWMLRWLVASYGQHTTAALLHDRLVRPGMTLADRVEADTVFFRALEESGNNWMRHRLMWAAVAVGGTMWSHKKKLCLLFFAHLVAFWAAVVWATGLLPWLEALWAGIAAAVLFLLGFAWRLAPTADPALSWWMWLAAAVGIGLVVPPCALIAACVRVVQVIDHLVAVIKGAGPQPYERPSPLKPPDLAKAEARQASVMWTAEPP
jgi:hypothetical protein